MKQLGLSIFLIFASCQTQPQSGCVSDQGCKGERICTNGICVDPRPTQTPIEIEATPKPEIKTNPPLQKPTAKSVRDIDWKNRTYLINSDDFFEKSTLDDGYGNCHMQSGCNSELENLRFKDGESSDDTTDRELFVRNVYFGDLTGDDLEDAVVLVSAKWNGEPEGNIAYAFRMSGEKPTLLGQIRIGSSNAGYRAITIQIDRGKVIVQHPKNTEGDTWSFDGTSMSLIR